MSIIIANASGEVDSAYHSLVKYINSPVPIVMVSYSDNFIFNEELLTLKGKPFIVIDFIEMGWNYDWGKQTEESYYNRFKGDEWKKFHDWASSCETLLCFKRELDAETAKIDGYVPIEYPCLVDAWPIQTKEGFNARPISSFHYWGRSNEQRLILHGKTWEHASKKSFSVCDNLYYINSFLREERGEKWVTINIPHYERVDLNNLMEINNLSKISISLPGAGNKCFRHSESPVNSVMLMQKNPLVWSFKWDESNCIIAEPGKEIEAIDEALKDEYLYDVYLEGMNNVDKYRLKNYLPYLEKIINDRL